MYASAIDCCMRVAVLMASALMIIAMLMSIFLRAVMVMAMVMRTCTRPKAVVCKWFLVLRPDTFSEADS